MMKPNERKKISKKLMKEFLAKGYTLEECRALSFTIRELARLLVNGNPTGGRWSIKELESIKTIKSNPISKPEQEGLLGMDEYVDEIETCMTYGSKGIFICGYHGLGKSSIVNMLAKKYNAEVVRVQVTEMTG